MNLKEIVPRVTLGGAFSFVIGYLAGKTVGAPITGGLILGTAGVAQRALQILVSDSAKKRDWSYSATVIVKAGVSLLVSSAGRGGLIALNILYPGKVREAAIWTGVGLIVGIAQLALTLFLHKIAETNNWSYSTVVLGQSFLTALGDVASTITLFAVGILIPSGAAIALAASVPFILTVASVYNALLLKWGGRDISFRKVLIEKIDPLVNLYQSNS
jgi:hypothetical protein